MGRCTGAGPECVDHRADRWLHCGCESGVNFNDGRSAVCFGIAAPLGRLWLWLPVDESVREARALSADSFDRSRDAEQWAWCCLGEGAFRSVCGGPGASGDFSSVSLFDWERAGGLVGERW